MFGSITVAERLTRNQATDSEADTAALPRGTMLRRVYAIARNTFREAVRDRVLYNLVLFVLLLTAGAIFLGELSAAQEAKIIIDLGLGAMLLFGTFIAIFVGTGLVYKEIERRTLYAILAKPVGRGEFLVGKYLGLALTLAVNVAVMGIGVSLALMFVRRGYDPLVLQVWPAIALIYVELLIIVAVALLFSAFLVARALGPVDVRRLHHRPLQRRPEAARHRRRDTTHAHLLQRTLLSAAEPLALHADHQRRARPRTRQGCLRRGCRLRRCLRRGAAHCGHVHLQPAQLQMNASPAQAQAAPPIAPVRRRMTRRELLLLVVIALGLASSAALSRWLETRRATSAPVAEREELYLKSDAVRRMSLGFNGLIADWYWMRSLQYVGHKVHDYQHDIQLDDLSPVGLTMLAPLLDSATTLDPQFIPVYEYGAVVLPALDVEAAIKLVRKGIAANPQAWRLYHHLGYIYWQQDRFQEAAESYRQGAQIAGAPDWMNAMAAQMSSQGGSRATAREIYRRMAEEADDEQMRELAAKRFLQLQSWDERDALRRLLAAYRTRTGRCPAAWRELTPVMRAARVQLDSSGAPLDPSNAPYALAGDGCDVELSEQSKILRK